MSKIAERYHNIDVLKDAKTFRCYVKSITRMNPQKVNYLCNRSKGKFTKMEDKLDGQNSVKRR